MSKGVGGLEWGVWGEGEGLDTDTDGAMGEGAKGKIWGERDESRRLFYLKFCVGVI